MFFAFNLWQPRCQRRQKRFDFRILIALHKLCRSLLEAVTPLRLFLINAQQLLRKNIPRQRRPQPVDPLLGKIALAWVRSIGNEMDVRMVSLIVKSRVPPQMLQRNFQALRERLRLTAQKIPPALTAVEAEPLRILAPQRNDRCVDVSLVCIQLCLDFRKLNGYVVVGEQAVRTETLRARTQCDIIRISTAVQQLSRVFFEASCDKLRGRALRLCAQIVLIF